MDTQDRYGIIHGMGISSRKTNTIKLNLIPG